MNRAATGLVVLSDPTLNIGIDDLGEDMITFSPQGNVTEMLPVATGLISSPNPYLAMTISFVLNKNSPVCQRWLNKIQTDSYLGNIVGSPDATSLAKIVVQGASIMTQEQAVYNGKTPGIGFTVQGIEPINTDLFG